MEKRDPKKNNIIPCMPKKMIKTIESKLNGETRLAICRGGVSDLGDDAGRSPEAIARIQAEKAFKEEARAAQVELEAARRLEMKLRAKKLEEEKRATELERERKIAEDRRIEVERKYAHKLAEEVSGL